MKKRLIVIGGGITGVTAIKAIREFDKEAEVVLICEEPFYPYTRIKLSKSLFDLLNGDSMLIQKKEWYEENNIDILVGVRATQINTDDNELLLSNGTSMKYDKLLLANGARNSRPPIVGIEKEGVFSLRTLADVNNIKNTIEGNYNILLIGGGIQGIEIAWIMHQNSKKITICEIQSRLMPNQLDEAASSILKQAIEKTGVSINLNTAVKEIVGEDCVQGVITNNGDRLDCDNVLYSTGIVPNIDIVAGTAINKQKGITVNDKMETNINNVYAAGDVAQLGGANLGLWNIAIGQGKVAGYNMIENESSYNNIVPVTTLNAFNISLFSMGNVQEENADTTLVEQELEANKYSRIFIKNSKIVGAIVIGDTRRSPILKAAIEKQSAVDGIDLARTSIEELLNELRNK